MIEERIANPEASTSRRTSSTPVRQGGANADWTKGSAAAGRARGPGAHGGAPRGQADRATGGRAPALSILHILLGEADCALLGVDVTVLGWCAGPEHALFFTG